MALFRRNKADQFINEAVEQTRGATEASHAGRFATILSAFALLFSGYSFYETVIKSADFAVYVAPRIAYTDPNSPDHPLEVFILPMTLANDGARTGTVLSIDLTVHKPRTGKSKKFYAANLGTWGVQPRTPFMPVALLGKDTWSQAVQFIPRAGEKVKRILDMEASDYRFELRLSTASSQSDLPFLKNRIRPLDFAMQTGPTDYRRFNRTGTQPMWSKDYQSAKTGGQ
ncbi:MAG: hypothetical protein L3J67_13790 [Hyphomicrobiaceae bacterium]|nr:hypothetical protein [Hyphomicrobiaceae bacterium]